MRERHRDEYYRGLEERLRSLIPLAARLLSPEVVKSYTEYLDAGEYGFAVKVATEGLPEDAAPSHLRELALALLVEAEVMRLAGSVADRLRALAGLQDERDFVVHLSPVWRERANFIIDADIEEEGSPRRFEQLWARQLGPSRFEICCIPFFVYDLALGDEVETETQGDRLYVIKRVVIQSGGYTFRAWFGNSNNPTARGDVIEALRELGCELEWYSQNLLAIDARDHAQAQEVADFLQERQALGHLISETGRTS